MRSKKGYIYSSTELSRYYGISIKGMAFYEEKDLIHPMRIGSGMTRRFGLQDCYRLASARMLHNCGFSLDETAHMLKDNKAEVLSSCLQERAEQMEQEILLQQGILAGIQRMQNTLGRIQRGDTPMEITTLPAMRWLFIRRFHGDHTSTSEEANEFCQWNNRMPITEASLHIPFASLTDSSPLMETEIGMIISEEDFHRYHLPEGNRVHAVPESLVIHGFLSCSETALDQKSALSAFFTYAEEHHLSLCGDCYTRLISSLSDSGENIRWDEVWLPVKSL
jgi:DNA-binding transcriptional MerR regulator